MSVSREDFRDAMASLAGAVSLITTEGLGGRAGMTATAVCSVSDTPPMLLTCVNENARIHNTMTENGSFCVNVLSPAALALSNIFSSKIDMDARFAAGEWTTLGTGSPVLRTALASFDCRIVNAVRTGTHTVFMGEVVDASSQSEDAASLIYFRRKYHNLECCL